MLGRRGRPPHREPVTPAEAKVLDLIRQGITNAEIAVRLGISVNTVRYHVSNLLAKAGAERREELAQWKPRGPGEGRWALATWRWMAAGAAGTVVFGIALAGVAALRGGDESARSPSEDVEYLVEVYAGTGEFGWKDGAGGQAMFADPRGLAVDEFGNLLVTELWPGCPRQVSPGPGKGDAGWVKTLEHTHYDDRAAGSTCETDRMYGPTGVAVAGDNLVAAGGRVYRFGPDWQQPLPGVAAPGLALAGELVATIQDVAADADGRVYVSDSGGRVIAIEPGGSARVLAGGEQGFRDGKAREAAFMQPFGLGMVRDGSLLVADRGSLAVRRVSRDGEVTTVAASIQGPAQGRGTAIDGPWMPIDVAADGDGNLWVTTDTPAALWLVRPGVDARQVATFDHTPWGVVVGPDGSVYVAESGGNRILRVRPR